MMRFLVLVCLFVYLVDYISEAFSPAPLHGHHVCKYKKEERKKRSVYNSPSVDEDSRGRTRNRRLFGTLFGHYVYDCCPGYTDKTPLGCFKPTCVTVPQDASLTCRPVRALALLEQRGFYRLTTPPNPLKSYPDETTNILEAVASPVLNQSAQNVLLRSLVVLPLHETKWVTTYLAMSIKNKFLSMSSLTPGHLTAFTKYSDYSRLLDFYRSEQQKEVLGFLKMSDVLRYPSQELPFKDIIENDAWQQDDIFTMQRFAGLNPMSLRLMKKEDVANEDVGTRQRVVDSSRYHWHGPLLNPSTIASAQATSDINLYLTFQIDLDSDVINKNYDWDGALSRATGDKHSTFDEMVKEGLVYILEYPLLHGLTNEEDIGDLRPNDRREMKSSRSPIAVFVSVENPNKINTLKPVAIQTAFNSSAVVRSPIDGSKWLLAKEEIQRADITYLEIIEHLLKSHLLMEPICVIARRTLAPLHPLNQIYKWHCRGLFVTNSLGLPALFNENEFLHILFAMGHSGGVELLNRGYSLMSWEDSDFKTNLEKRGVTDLKKLPYFPYRDDGLLLWKEIGNFAEEYVNLYYENDKAVKKDNELANFANELSADGHGTDGGMGKLKDFPSKIETKADLTDVVKRIVFIPIQHCAVNYPVAYYGAFVPNNPTKLYDDPRVPFGEFGFNSLPQANLATYQVALSMSLGSLRYDRLFDYGKHLVDKRAQAVINKYHDNLMGDINDIITERNNNRLKVGLLSYPYFLPKWIPNSIHT